MKISRPKNSDNTVSGNTLTTTVKKDNAVVSQKTEQVLTENTLSPLVAMANISVGFSRTVAPAAFESVRVEIGIQLPVAVDSYVQAVSETLAFSEEIVNSRISVYKPSAPSPVKFNAIAGKTTPEASPVPPVPADPALDSLDELDDVLHPAGSVAPTTMYQNSKPVKPQETSAGLDELDDLDSLL